MKCEDLRALAYGYTENLLPAEERARIEAHTADCSDCADFVATARTLTCQQFTHFLDDYFEGHLGDAQRATFQKHIELCPPCGDYLSSYERTIHLGKHAVCRGEPLPPNIPEGLIQAILEARKRQA